MGKYKVVTRAVMWQVLRSRKYGVFVITGTHSVPGRGKNQARNIRQQMLQYDNDMAAKDDTLIVWRVVRKSGHHIVLYGILIPVCR